MRHVPDSERRARLAVRHHLACGGGAGDVAHLARDEVALHSTDPATVFLSIWARMPGATVEAVERALYDERSVVRMLAMRRTVFAVPVELEPVVQAACTEALLAGERRKAVQLLEAAGVEDGERWLARVQDATMEALRARGDAFATELASDVPELRRNVTVGAGTRWEATQTMTSRVLFLLAAEGRIARGRPRGSWISSQYRWAPMELWLPGRDAAPSTGAARTELARRWLAAFGPGTVADLKWWTGLTMTETRRALAPLAPVEVTTSSGTALLLPDDVEPVAPPEPWAAFLPPLDSTVMAWPERTWFLGDHGPRLFDRSGNAGPTVWWDGRVVGGWATRDGGEVVYRLLEDVGADAATAIEARAVALAAWLARARVTPRFRTPLERELSI